MTGRIVSLRMLVLLGLCFLGVGSVKAQTATFTFTSGPIQQLSYKVGTPVPTPQPFAGIADMLSWNGTACPGGPYCQEMGAITFSAQPTRSDIDIPFQLGFPNDGYLQGCSIVYGQPQGAWIVTGNAFTISGTGGSCYDGGNTTFTFTQNYVVTRTFVSCYRGSCLNNIDYQMTGGGGTVTNQPSARVIPRCGSRQLPCPGFGGGQ